MCAGSRRTSTCVLLVIAVAVPLGATTFVVTNANDAGAGSLRQAILDANGAFGTGEIDFAIPGSGVHTISLQSPLPPVVSPTFIDGYTQPGASPNTNPPGQGLNAVLEIEIDGTGVGNVGPCLTVAAGNSAVLNMVIQGLVINRCGSASESAGIEVSTGGDNALIEGNFIGTDPTGATSPGAQEYGILVDGASGVAVAGNLISGNTWGVELYDGPSAIITRNLIGTNAAGDAPIGSGPPTPVGIDVNSSSNVTIGGATPDLRNVVSGCYSAIQTGVLASDLQVVGNFVGTDVSGTRPIGNSWGGVDVAGSSALVTGNVIAASGFGLIVVDGAVVRGNFIGTDPTASIDLGNIGTGVRAAGDDVWIGGTDPSEGNVIAHNHSSDGGGGGVAVFGTADRVRFNRIFDNFPLGIDLVSTPAGVTPNDAGDTDTGPNYLQNFPMITSVVPGATTTHIEGLLNSTPSTTFDVDLYADPACSDRPQAYLQADAYLASLPVTTDGFGDATFSIDVPVVLEPGQPVTATATDPGGNTSELSQRIVFSISPRSGPASGGTATTISGMLFEPGSTVTVGSMPASNVMAQSPQSISADMPALPAGSVNDVTVAVPSGLVGTLKNGWVADFLDVPQAQQFHDYVVTVVANGIAAGVGGGNYGVADPTLRQQMAVFLLKGKHGVCYTPPPCTGIFSDVPCPSLFADWIEALAGEGITGGCGGGQYCPQNAVRRDQMAAFLLKAEHGASYVPPACAGVFSDVACPSLFADWIEELYAEGVTGGCGTNPLIYCPSNPVTRGQMAVFLTKSFFLN